MFDVYRMADMVSMGLHVGGGLLGAAAHIVSGDLVGGIYLALTVAACILILGLAVAGSEVLRVSVKRFVRKQERGQLPAPPDKRD